MATVTLNASALPADTKSASFSFGNTTFELATDGKFETSDPAVVADALNHPWLKVEVQTVEEPAHVAYDPNDPHQNPAADHLSGVASQEVKDKAEANEAAIREAADGAPQVAVPQAEAAKPTPEVQAEVAHTDTPTLGASE